MEGVREPKVAAILLFLVFTVGCSGMTGLTPTGPSQSLSPSQPLSLAPPPAVVSGPLPDVITGTVSSLDAGGPRCHLGLYSCEVYNFPLASEGGFDVTLAWEGGERSLMVQLYRADVGLVHEDLAPRGGASRITFRRPNLAAMDYQIRVVNLQRDAAIPFTLSVMRWEN